MLDVELDERVELGCPFMVRSQLLRVLAGPGEGLFVGDSVVVLRRQHRLAVKVAAHQTAAHCGDAEPTAFLVAEADDDDRTSVFVSLLFEDVDRYQGRYHSQGTVVGASTGDGVEMAPGGDCPRPGITPPSPLVPVAIGFHGQAPPLGLLTEPVPRHAVLFGPCQSSVTGGGAADGRQSIEA